MASRGQKFITKHLGIPLEKGFESQDDGTITVKGFFTSDNVDEIGDIITREATENAIPKYREWGNIRYMHMPKPVAKVLNIGKDDGLKWNEVEIHVIDPEAIFQVKNGLLKALSVGIIIKSFDDIEIDEETWAWTINAYDLAEISLVDHPANYDARLFLDEDKNIPVSTELRQLVAANGFAVVSKALGAVSTLEEGIDMAQLEQDLQTDEEEVIESAEEETEEEEIELSLEEDDEEEEVDEETDEEAGESEDMEELVEEGIVGTVDEDEDAPWTEDEEEVEAELEEELVLEEGGVQLEETTEEEDELLEVLTDSLEAEEDEEADIEAEEAIEEADEEDETILNNEFVLEVAQAIVDLLSEAEAEAPAVEETEEEQPEAEKVEVEDEDATSSSSTSSSSSSSSRESSISSSSVSSSTDSIPPSSSAWRCRSNCAILILPSSKVVTAPRAFETTANPLAATSWRSSVFTGIFLSSSRNNRAS